MNKLLVNNKMNNEGNLLQKRYRTCLRHAL